MTWSQRELLRNIEDDDDADEPPAADSPRFASVPRRSEPAPRTTRASIRATSGRGTVMPPSRGTPRLSGAARESGLSLICTQSKDGVAPARQTRPLRP